ncbi:carbohydrate ABC transporter permease [Paenibacillus lycopersici]|uniref:Carbohydrate ABC transporter permease n=1 Tax=Paenibacillus lycopersici TaxID=2704462 RepID=A0A6C0FVD8_9BACL|nr:carbohydrate ABC transporter permease [Paenibacillus lycopersici]QHT59431.1 carbohydrate ABC transporter permease [Paenibacillus lycopersici]
MEQLETRWSKKAALYALLLLLAVIFAFPLYWLLINSLQPLFTGSVVVPAKLSFHPYKLVFTLRPYFMYFKNSLILAAISVTLPLISSFLSGFAFARLRAKGKGMLFMLILSTMMLPATVTQIPQYILFKQFGFLGTYWPWILSGLGGAPFLIFLYRQFFMNIPRELDEAARIDGCSTYGIIFRIYLPISVPIIATAAIMSFNFSWGQDFFMPFMFLQEKQYPLATILMSIGYYLPEKPSVQLDQVQEGATVLFILPIVLVFLFGQRYLISGMISGAIKS